MKNKIITAWLFYIAFVCNSRAQSISLSVSNVTNSSFTLNWTGTGGTGGNITSYNIYNNNTSTWVATGISSTTSSYNISAQPCSSYNMSVVGDLGAITRPGDPGPPDPSRSSTQVISNSVTFQTPSLNGSANTIDLSSSMTVTSNITDIAFTTINILPGVSIVALGSGTLFLAIANCGGNYTPRSSSDITELPAEQTKLTDNFNSNIQIYPNPVNDKITIDMVDVTENTTVTIINFAGQTIYSNNITDSKTIIDLSSYSPGIYMAKIVSNGTSKTIKLVKN